MSRAFVKEVDDAPPPPPLERPLSGAPNLVTMRGLRLIEERVAGLEAAISQASSEEDKAPHRRDLRYWLARRASAQPVEGAEEPESAGFATRLTIRRRGKVRQIVIVGEDEADPSAGRIAWTAPLARALDGAGEGEVVELEAGGRREEIALIKVAPADED